MGFVVPLIVASLLVVFGCSRSSGGLFSSDYYSSAWSSITSGGGSDSVAPTVDAGERWELRPMVGGVGEREEAHSGDYVLNQSVTPSLAVEEREITAQEQSVRRYTVSLSLSLFLCSSLLFDYLIFLK